MNCRDFRETCWETSGLVKTAEGYLVGEIIATGAGVFTYLDANGRKVRRLRSVDDVKSATDSLANKPITLLHPNEDVTADNIQKYGVGSIGSVVSFDGLNNKVQVTIMDKKAVSAIESGSIKAVSCGYECEIVKESGVWQGVQYDERQVNIVYNHLALVPAGRAGDGVNFRVRCGDAIEFDSLTKTKDSKMKKTTLRDGSIVELEDSIFDEIKFLKDSVAESNKALDTMTAERDAAKASNTKLQKDMDELKSKSLDEDAIKARVATRIALLKAADEAGVEKAEDMEDRDIKCAVIKSELEEISLDDKSDEYVQAMYDACISSRKKRKATDKGGCNKNKSLDSRGEHMADGADAAYQKMCDQFYGVEKKEA